MGNSKEKQIEEMAELERLLRIRRMDIEKQGCDIWALIKKTESEEQSIANYLIGHGYRKASEVAREVIDDFDKELHKLADRYHEQGKIEYFTLCEIIYQLVIAELKKKYTEDGK
jgi:hypothetical protein